MTVAFWTNTVWYIFLGVLTIVELLYVFTKVDRKWFTFAFYLSILGLTLNFETVILIFLNAYEYYPYILKNPALAYDDILAGNVFSQTSVSATGLLFSVLKLKNYWAIFFGFIYGGIELLFLHLGIYQQNWYATWMTLILIPLFILCSKWLYNKLNNGVKPVFYYLYIYLGLFPLYIVFFLWGVLLLTEIASFNMSFFDNPVWSRSILVLLQFNLYSWILMDSILNDRKIHTQVVSILFLFIVHYVCFRMNLFIIKDGWFFIVAFLSIGWMYLSIYFMNKWYGGNKRTRFSSLKQNNEELKR